MDADSALDWRRRIWGVRTCHYISVFQHVYKMEIQHLYQVPVQWSQRVYIYIYLFIFIFIFILVQKLAGKKTISASKLYRRSHCQSHHGFPGLHAWDGWVLRWPGELESVHEAYWNPYCFLGYHVSWESEGALIQFQSHGHQLTFWVLVSLLDTKLKLFWDGCWRELLYTCGVDINILIQANVIYLWGRETPNKVIEGIGYRADIQIRPQPTVRLTDVNIRSTH